jgi:predicted thioesterase
MIPVITGAIIPEQGNPGLVQHIADFTGIGVGSQVNVRQVIAKSIGHQVQTGLFAVQRSQHSLDLGSQKCIDFL